MKKHKSNSLLVSALVVLAMVLAGRPVLAAGDYSVQPYVVGGTDADARNVDKIMIGVQHWYADQLDGKTFRVNPTQRASSAEPLKKVEKGKINVIIDLNWKSTGKGAAGWGIGEANVGGWAWINSHSGYDQILRHASGYLGEDTGWSTIVHEVGHAFGLEHAKGSFMGPVAGEANPYDPSRNKVGMSGGQKGAIENSNFIAPGNDPGLSGQQVRNILDGKAPSPGTGSTANSNQTSNQGSSTTTTTPTTNAKPQPGSMNAKARNAATTATNTSSSKSDPTPPTPPQNNGASSSGGGNPWAIQRDETGKHTPRNPADANRQIVGSMNLRKLMPGKTRTAGGSTSTPSSGGAAPSSSAGTPVPTKKIHQPTDGHPYVKGK